MQSDNFNNIMSSFELDPSNPRSAEAMARGDPVDAFLQVRQTSNKVNLSADADTAFESYPSGLDALFVVQAARRPFCCFLGCITFNVF